MFLTSKCKPNKSKYRVLFICKKRTESYGVSFGLLNSSEFISNFLNKNGIESKSIAVIDNNCIDKEVKEYKPTHVIISALWVVPKKFYTLLRLYPNIKWITRIHSKVPFLANEGIALDWLYEYYNISQIFNNFFISCNSMNCVEDLNYVGIKTDYMPNIYCPNTYEHNYTHENESPLTSTVNIGCFGAIRPMKNHLTQAFAAIQFAKKYNLNLKFHINATRIEQRGDAVLKNLEELFSNNPKYELIEHSWMNHCDFIELIKSMDIGMQVSFSETFNIVAADLVSNNVPVVVSREMEWLPWWIKANPNSVNSISNVLALLWVTRKLNLQFINRMYLDTYNYKSGNIWLKYF